MLSAIVKKKTTRGCQHLYYTQLQFRPLVVVAPAAQKARSPASYYCQSGSLCTIVHSRTAQGTGLLIPHPTMQQQASGYLTFALRPPMAGQASIL